VVLASEDAYLEDASHFARGVVPGDGIHTVLPTVIGNNRAREYLLTGRRLTARNAVAWGAVNEVLPRAELLSRAYALAARIADQPPPAMRLARAALIRPLRHAATAGLTSGVYQELYAMRGFLSWRGDQQPLDRAWNDDPWSGEART
jgi:enoyl-CoA hydratase/carnithine racemase